MKKEKKDNSSKACVQNTKTKIMEATLQILWKNGYKGTTTKQIADLAGVNEVTIFRNFGNKEKLIEETFNLSDAMTDPLKELLKNEFPTVRDFLDEFSELMYTQWNKNKEINLSTLRELGSKQSDFTKRQVEAVKYIIKLFTEKLMEMHKQGKIKKSSIKDLSNIYHSATMSVYIWHSVNGNITSDKDIRNYLKSLSKVLTKGIE
ncbi:MAG: TetR/AcrR family transcriptional regulator [Spirochaetes bacterium]|nr:TetR/AcrR family transcriptional regulator [Spirochaetota bacterium]